MKRDCTCPRARHVHGTRAMHDNCGPGCRCFPCRVASADARTAHRHGGHWREGWSDLTDATGTRRRLQALAAIGVPLRVLADRLDVPFQYVSRLRSATTVRADTAQRVEALYDDMWDAPAHLRQARTRTWAVKLGYHPPLAWDDDEIDNPDAEPHVPTGPSPWDHRACGTPAAARRHYRRGERLDAACLNAARRQKNDRKKAA